MIPFGVAGLGPVLSFPGDVTPPDLAAAGVRFVLDAQRTHRHLLYDTVDLRLARWGCCLRRGADDAFVVLVPGAGPVEVPGEGGGPVPAEAELLVRSFARKAPLQVVASTRTTVRPLTVIDPGGRPVAELARLEVAVDRGGGPSLRLQEVELGAGADPGLAELIAELVGSHPQPGVPLWRRVLGPAALQPPEVVAAEVDAGSGVAEVVGAGLAASVVRLVRNVPIAVVGAEPEGVHQARVALRRLRSDLATFSDLFEPGWANALRDRAGAASSVLGRVRDLDVLSGRLERRREQVSFPARLDRVRDVLADRHRRARRELLEYLGGDAYLDLVESLVTEVTDPPVRDAGPEAALAMVRERHRALRKTVAGLSEPPGDVELHDVRIRAKRLRYAAELLIPLSGDRVRQLAAAAEQVQELLGELHDAVVAIDWLQGLADHPRLGFTAGELAAREAAAAETVRASWRQVWSPLAGGRLSKRL